MIIGISKNNCTRSDERNRKQLHLDTSAPFDLENCHSDKNQELELGQLDTESENKEKEDTSIYIGPTPLAQNLRLIKEFHDFIPDVLPDAVSIHHVHG